LKYFNGVPKRIKLTQIENFYNLVTTNRNFLDTRLYVNKDGTAIIKTSVFECPGVEEQLKNIFNVNPKLFTKSEEHLVFYTIYFDL
jgi:hypothetical protein